MARASLGALPDAGQLTALGRRLDRPWALGRVTRGFGVVAGADAAAWGGPTARAAGFDVDARAHSPAYAGLGFEPVLHGAGDIRDRWRQRLAETAQAVELAARGASTALEPGEPLEPPAPPAPADAESRLAALIVGAEWGDAVVTISSVVADPFGVETPAAPG